MILDSIFYNVYGFLNKRYELHRAKLYKKQYNFPNSVNLRKVIIYKGSNVIIGNNTYINSGYIQTGPNSKVIIGEWCAIGYNVNIITLSHDIENPTGNEKTRPRPEADIIIGNNVWIGTNVFINKGVTIGDNAIIGANSVVVKDVQKNSIVGGVPAKLIRFK